MDSNVGAAVDIMLAPSRGSLFRELLTTFIEREAPASKEKRQQQDGPDCKLYICCWASQVIQARNTGFLYSVVVAHLTCIAPENSGIFHYS